MVHLIDKSAVVAEINRVLNSYDPNEITSGRYALASLRDFLDTLEVKEDSLFTETKIEKELAKSYINIFDKKFGNKLPNLKGKQLAEFKCFINTCEQTFHMKYFDYHATQGKLFEKLALLWAVWGKEHLNLEVKDVDLEKEIEKYAYSLPHSVTGTTSYVSDIKSPIAREFGIKHDWSYKYVEQIAEHFYELGLKAQKGE